MSQIFISLIFFRIAITGPQPITPKQVPPPPLFPHSRSQKASSPFGEIARRHATRALFVRHKRSAFLQATTARDLINWCPSLCNVRSF